MSLVKDEHNKCLRQSLKRFYEEEMLTDVVINVSGRKFKCHRIILASLSVYYETLFHSQFIDAQEKELTLQVDGSTFEEVINFMYCRTDTINTLNAENLFKIADFLQIESLKEVLEQQLLKDLSVENCLEWFRLADLYNCPRLLEKSLSMTAGNFGSVFDNDQFLLLSSNLICNVLSKTNLSVPSEENIFEAVVKWYRADIKGRKSSLSFILEQIRFPQMSLGYLEKVGKESFMKPLSRLRLIEEAKNYQSNPHLRYVKMSPSCMKHPLFLK
ncbi:hypothetical protein LOTGIDRAFT_133026 [Lottia gigantea]|uniref:BTB domain-containing protein n=1 Tax=Lottia gigantea TaxID=225164 RepID=V3YZM2_LOTGI|nr:hypothetical protein LOTGIDRAFT_133026 [Lottia gigantea]ESO83658.1 hypothetical protein LOTGIDRAFT_133026 [Lottia gigantea]